MQRGSRALRLTCYWLMVGLTGAFFIAGVVLTLGHVRTARNAGTSMEDTLMPGDKLLYLTGSPLRRGDLVIVRAGGSTAHPVILARRVIGLPGDQVACCDARGRVTVNGRPLAETYLHPGDAPSLGRFSVTLRAGQAWLLGDDRAVADDSRHQGPASLADIIGRITAVDRNGRFAAVHTPAAYVRAGLAPPDHRTILPLNWLFAGLGAAAACASALLTGLLLSIRRRGARTQLAASTAYQS